MRCPKCQYISFDSGERCRNCGYDFSLIEPDAPLDLPISTGDEPVGPMADLQLGSRSGGSASIRTADALEVEPADRSASRRGAVAATVDLPLFTRDGPADAPIVTPPAVPRPPLSVRRGAPVITRPRPRRGDTPDFEDEPELDLAPDETTIAAPEQARGRALERTMAAVPLVEPASAAARLFAASVDLLIVGSIDVGVLYLTLRVLGLTFADVGALPQIPLVAFLLLLNGGYATIFTTAGGQTIGKMLAGIRVVQVFDGGAVSRVPLDRAVVRSAAYLVSLVPFGMGFIVALFSADGRALHDKVAETRVIEM